MLASSIATDAPDSFSSMTNSRPRKRKSLWDLPAAGHQVVPLESLKAANATLISALISQALLLPSPASTPAAAGASSLSPSSASITRPNISSVNLSSSHALSNTSTASKLDRRIYVGSLSYDINEETIAAIFSPFGLVTKVDMPKEPGTLRSKGFCFLEFDRIESAQAAQMTMNGVMIKGRPMKIGKPTAGSGGIDQSAALTAKLAEQGFQTPQQMAMIAANIAAGQENYNNGNNNYNYNNGQIIDGSMTTTTNPSPPSASPASSRILVSHLHPDLISKDVSDLFDSFGSIKSQEFDADNHQCVIEFDNPEHADMAAQNMDGMEILAHKMKCELLPIIQTEQITTSTTQIQQPSIIIPQLPQHLIPQHQQQQQSQQIPVMIPTLPAHLTNPSQSLTSLRNEEGLSISSQSQRASIMNKLASSSHRQSPVILLTNLIDANQIDSELENDVKEECQKFGLIKKIHIDPNYQLNTVKIFVEFFTVVEALKACESLNGRFFAGRIVQAHFYPQNKFDAGNYHE